MTLSTRKPLRSQATRDGILAAAQRLFGELGFERTTIRAVASAAGINPAMVMRYYGSKENLFATAALIDFHMPDLAALPASQRGEALIAHVLDQWEASDALPALLRASGTHEAARARLVDAVGSQAGPVISAVLPGAGRQERLALIMIQIAGLVLSRYVLMHPAIMRLDRATIIRRIGAVVQNYITGDDPPP